ncbi:MAG: Fur family transcriptional regulator [Coriobacteriia bacterium]|nr:Fur family transcriptional regulator [Coriobacteriia bacterium]
MLTNSEFLRSYDLKVTPTRIAVLEVLQESKKPKTAEELYDLVKMRRQISLATVYRTLSQFSDAGFVMKETTLEGSMNYQLSRENHSHYIICTRCHTKIDLGNCPLDKLSDSIQKATGFTVTGHSLELSGLCPDCQKKN